MLVFLWLSSDTEVVWKMYGACKYFSSSHACNIDSSSYVQTHNSCRMIAGFGSGAAFSLVSGMTQGNPLMGAFSTGTLFALLQGAFYQVLMCICCGCEHSCLSTPCALCRLVLTSVTCIAGGQKVSTACRQHIISCPI